MRSLVWIGCLALAVVFTFGALSGCSLTQTASEHQHVYDRCVYHDVLLIPDDVDTFFMLDRPTRLSRWLTNY